MNKVEEKKSSETVSFVADNINEILKATPRRGTTIKKSPQQELLIEHSTPIKDSEQFLPFSVEEKISREFRIQAALEENESIDSKNATVSKPLANAAHMLSIAFSTIMMLAANHSNIPKEYLNWTTKCLENITDELGNYPPNVRGVLKHIKNRKEDSVAPKEEVNTQQDE